MAHLDLKKTVAHGLAWEAGAKVFLQIFSWAVTVVVAGLIGPQAYGVVAISGLFTVTLQMVADFGMTSGLITEKVITPQKLRGVFWFNLYMSAALYVALFVAAPVIAQSYSLPELEAVIRVAGLGLFVSALRAVPMAMILRGLDFRRRVAVETLGQVFQSLTVLLLALRGHGFWSLTLGYLVGQSISTLLILKASPAPGYPTFALGEIRPLLAFGTRMTSTRLVGHLLSISDTAVASAALGHTAVGIFSMAAQLAYMPMDKIGSIVSRISFPTIAALADSRTRAGEFFLATHLWLLAVAGPMVIGVAFVSPEIIELLFPEKWSDVAPVLSGLCVAAFFKLSNLTLFPVLEGMRKARALFWYTLVNIPILIPAFLIGARWGVAGIAISWAIASPILWWPLLSITLKSLGLSVSRFLREMAPVLLALAAMIGVLLAAQYQSTGLSMPWRLASKVALGAITYVAVLAIAVPRSRRAQLRELLGKLKGSA